MLKAEHVKTGYIYVDNSITVRVINSSIKMYSLVTWVAGVVYEDVETREQFCISFNDFIWRFDIQKPKKETSPGGAQARIPLAAKDDLISSITVVELDSVHEDMQQVNHSS